MKNKIYNFIFLLFFALFSLNVNSQEQFNFDVTQIDILENGNKFIGTKRGTITSNDGIIINAGALTHTSIGLLDALNMFKGPKIELHITNIYARENFRHKSYISPVVNGIIAGFGFNSYLHAIDAIKDLIKD